ncbi:MAG: lysophospholipid acyltransferase family protein, partial [Acidimicrobiales bacterium]|nr:lysophospholipid acyltransferase family protein [Acidimicrobiales bacterium]
GDADRALLPVHAQRAAGIDDGSRPARADGRGRGRQRRALEAANRVLEHGRAVAMFPEGTRSRDGLLHGGNLGAARLSIATGAPILPVGLIGTAEVQPIGRRLPRTGKRVDVRFGDLLYPDCDASPRAEMRDLTHHMMDAIGALCGQSTVRQRRDLVPA